MICDWTDENQIVIQWEAWWILSSAISQLHDYWKLCWVYFLRREMRKFNYIISTIPSSFKCQWFCGYDKCLVTEKGWTDQRHLHSFIHLFIHSFTHSHSFPTTYLLTLCFTEWQLYTKLDSPLCCPLPSSSGEGRETPTSPQKYHSTFQPDSPGP